MTLSRKLQGAGVQLDCSPARSPASTTRTAAGLVLLDGVSLLRPDEQVFTAMLDGWRAQRLARNLAFGTIDKRLNSVRAFARHADAFPWSWRSQMIDEWLADLRGARGRCRSAVRNRKDATMTVKPRASAPSWSLSAGVSPCSVAWLSLFGSRCSGSGARAGRRRAEKSAAARGSWSNSAASRARCRASPPAARTARRAGRVPALPRRLCFAPWQPAAGIGGGRAPRRVRLWRSGPGPRMRCGPTGLSPTFSGTKRSPPRGEIASHRPGCRDYCTSQSTQLSPYFVLV